MVTCGVRNVGTTNTPSGGTAVSLTRGSRGAGMGEGQYRAESGRPRAFLADAGPDHLPGGAIQEPPGRTSTLLRSHDPGRPPIPLGLSTSPARPERHGSCPGDRQQARRQGVVTGSDRTAASRRSGEPALTKCGELERGADMALTAAMPTSLATAARRSRSTSVPHRANSRRASIEHVAAPEIPSRQLRRQGPGREVQPGVEHTNWYVEAQPER